MTNTKDTTAALIPVLTRPLGTETLPTVNARDLHTFLGPKARFNDWIHRRIQSYGFQEDRDFTVLKNEYVHEQNAKASLEYYLSLDMAKELSQHFHNIPA